METESSKSCRPHRALDRCVGTSPEGWREPGCCHRVAVLRGRLWPKRATNRLYTPAEGVNIDVGNPATPNKVVHVRNLAIISWGPGEGVPQAPS